MATQGLSAPSFTTLLDRYFAFDPSATRKMQDLRASMESGDFLRQLWAAIEEKPPAFAVRLPASLVSIEDTARMLLEVYGQSKRRANALAKKLLLGDPQFDVKLLHCFGDKEISSWTDEQRLVALDILDAVSERDRLVLAVSTLLRQPNAKLRSKAALFIARRRPALNWIADLSGQTDARFRANVIEGLFGASEDFIAPLFRKHAIDENNRVAGNAALGLYRLGELESIQTIDAMAVDERSLFRLTSAWVMGQTGDPRFSSVLAAQLSDEDAAVRRLALKSLGDIKRSLAEARSQTPWQLGMLKRDLEQGTHSLITTVCDRSDAPVRAIPPTRFFLKACGNYVRKYALEEYGASAPVHAALVLCLPPEEGDLVSTQFEAAAARCARVLRKKDDLTVTTIPYETSLRCSAIGINESKAILKMALNEIEFEQVNLNVILVGAGPCTHLFDRLSEVKATSKFMLNLISISPEWQNPEFRRRTLAGGGVYRNDLLQSFGQSCVEIVSSLVHHYRITWEEGGDGDLELEVQGEGGTAIASFEDGLPEAPQFVLES